MSRIKLLQSCWLMVVGLLRRKGMGRPAAEEATQRMIWSVLLVLSGIKKMSAAESRSPAASTASIFVQVLS